MSYLSLQLFSQEYAVCKLPPESPTPAWANAQPFSSITRTEDELSIVTLQQNVPAGTKSESGWRLFRVEGTLDFNLVGILYSIAKPLAEAKISLLAIGTYDTDYFLIKKDDLSQAKACLQAAGFEIHNQTEKQS